MKSRFLQLVVLMALCAPFSAFASTVASQPDAASSTLVWLTGTGSGIANVNTGVVNLGTPFAVDTQISGFQFYMKSVDDGTNVAFEVDLVYADMAGGTACADTQGSIPGHDTLQALGSTSVDISNSMQLVSIICSATIDHTRPLAIEPVAASDAHQSAVYVLSNGSQIAFQLTDNGVYTGAFSGFGTRIDSVIPYSGALVATSSTATFGVTGYVASSDFVSGNTNVDMCITKAQPLRGDVIFSPVAIPLCDIHVVFPVSLSGAFSYSTTSALLDAGGYAMVSQIEVPFISLFGINIGSNYVAATSTSFTAATSTLADQVALGQLALLTNLQVSSSTSQDVCNPAGGTFNATYCVYSFFLPSTAQWQQLGNDVAAIISEGPWGFMGTTLLILQGHYFDPGGSDILPTPTFNLSGTHLAGTAGLSAVALSPWGVLASSSIVSTATSPDTGNTLQEIISPGWTGFVLLMFLLAIMNELVGVGGKVVSS